VAAIAAHRSGPLSGAARVPGDKSISHRALLIGALAVGETTAAGLLEGEDVLRTAAALRTLGAEIWRDDGGLWHIAGRGIGGFAEPDGVLDLGNSGTSVRLLMGALACHGFTTFLTGDDSLRRRPMARVAHPLRAFGATILCRSGGRLPLALTGTDAPVPITYEVPVPSAQVKSAVLLAGLGAPGVTTVIERQRTRDHTERMLRAFGADIETTAAPGGGASIALHGQPELAAQALRIPADPSSAAFPLVAALCVPGSAVSVAGVGFGAERSGLYHVLREMGAALEIRTPREESGEPVADLIARAGALRGIEVSSERAPTMIDEYPILAVAAACAEGTTRLRGLAELRVKESDRLAAIAHGLTACGVQATIEDDDLTIAGCGGPPPGGATIAVQLDHRIAMAFLVLGLAARRPVAIDDDAAIATSFPSFVALLRGLGADFRALS